MSMHFANCEFRSAVYRFDHTVTDAFFVGKFMSYSCDEYVTGCPSVVLMDIIVKCYDKTIEIRRQQPIVQLIVELQLLELINL